MNRKSFTLVELLVVIAVIGLLASLIIVNLSGTRGKASIARGLQFNQSVYHALGAEAVGVWSFDEGSGATANDASGYGNNGALYNFASPHGWTNNTPSNAGYALSFDGSNDYIQVPYMDVFDQKPFTVVGWVWSDVSKSDEILFGTGDSSTADKYLHLVIRSRQPRLGFYSDDLQSGTFLPLNAWVHLAFVWEGPATKYINGVKDCERVSSGLLNVTSGVSSGNGGWIGRWSAYNHDGMIDDVRIYATALSVSQIQQLYAETAPKYRLVLE